MIRHFIVERDPPEPREWDPAHPAPELPKDCPYFGKALIEMEKHLDPEEDIHCYLTWDNDSLPEYGPHVIAILVGEEWGLMPRYARHVRMVARVMSRYPSLGIRRWWPMNRLMLLLLPKHLRNWQRHLCSWVRYKRPPSDWPAPIVGQPNLVHLPWGSANLVEVPLTKMSERHVNYFFSGSIAFGTVGYRKLTGGPKIYSREALVKAVTRLEQKYPALASNRAIVVHKDVAREDLTDDESYALRLMDAKVCLAPRGSVADTWRYFEGLKSGCAVITNPLPDEWYYRDAPVIQIDHWDELEGTLLPLLGDAARLDRMQAAALDYWENVCGEKAVGRFLAAALNSGKPA